MIRGPLTYLLVTIDQADKPANLVGFAVTVERTADANIVTPVGELDLSTSPRLRSVTYDLALESSSALILDLTQVPFIDSTALGGLIALRRWTFARSSRLVMIVEPRSVVDRVLKVSGLDKTFHLAESRELAQELLRPLS
jgi:anti-sigma B factor antagonist